MTSLGYIKGFDGVEIVDDTSKLGGVSKKAQSIFGNTDEVIDRFKDLPNGTRVNYDIAADADVRPGSVVQRVSCSSGAVTFHDAIAAKKKFRGTITKRKWADSTTLSCTGVLMDVKIESASSPILDYVLLALHFKLETFWS